MKTVRFLVEGVKDVFFLRALFAARFSRFQYVGSPTGYENGALFKSVESSVEIEIVPVGGYAKLDKSKASAENKEGIEWRVAIIFDADTTGVERGGVAARTGMLNSIISSWKLLAPPTMPIDVFLFPDNRRDGELEDLLEDIVPQRFRPLIAECWRRYELCLEVHGGQKPSQKSKMNDYEAAVIGPSVWEHKGIMKGLLDPNLWDWKSEKLFPLVDFIEKQLASLK